ncbi:MAG: hypothetical protein GEU28_05565 [Dehalococcoidia bacterium]|nr:hypothetical protein [Dehalococcoidia bacterium]
MGWCWNGTICVPAFLRAGSSSLYLLQRRPAFSPCSARLDNGGVKILVTLDGSELSESILNPVLDLCRASSLQLRLYSVLDPDDVAYLAGLPTAGGSPPPEKEPHGQAQTRLLQEIQARLEELAGRFRAAGAGVETETALGDPSDLIISEARRWQPRLIAMATHGRTGFAEQLMGSVSASVLKSGVAPVLLVGPPPGES